MLDRLAYATHGDSVATVAGGLGAYVIPRLMIVARIGGAGGILGAVTGLVIGGMKCLDLQERGALDIVATAWVLGRDVTTGVASGIAASAASLYVSVAGAAVCAVISAPAWVPPTAAVTAAIGVGYVVTKASHAVWDSYVA